MRWLRIGRIERDKRGRTFDHLDAHVVFVFIFVIMVVIIVIIVVVAVTVV